jgi:hypothetical protein
MVRATVLEYVLTNFKGRAKMGISQHLLLMTLLMAVSQGCSERPSENQTPRSHGSPSDLKILYSDLRAVEISQPYKSQCANPLSDSCKNNPSGTKTPPTTGTTVTGGQAVNNVVGDTSACASLNPKEPANCLTNGARQIANGFEWADGEYSGFLCTDSMNLNFDFNGSSYNGPYDTANCQITYMNGSIKVLRTEHADAVCVYFSSLNANIVLHNSGSPCSGIGADGYIDGGYDGGTTGAM